MPRSYVPNSPNVMSNSVTYAVPVKPGIGSSILGGLHDLLGVAAGRGQADEREAQAGYYRSETEAKAAATARAQSKDSTIGTAAGRLQDELDAANKMDDPNAADQARSTAYSHFETSVAPYYGDANGAEGMRKLQMDHQALGAADPNATPFSRNVASTFMDVDGHALKDNEALTDADNANRFQTTEARKTAKDEQASKDERFKATTAAGATTAAAGIRAGADVKVGAGHDAASRDNNAETNRTSRFNKIFDDDFKYRTGALAPKASGAGYTSTSTKDDGQGNKTTTTTVRKPNARPGPATGPADPLGIR